jgi:seryl-tRNA synthetase
MSAIKDIIKMYISLDDELKKLAKQAATLRTQKKTLGEQITDYLKKNSDSTSSVLEIGKDSFKIVTCKKTKINKAHIENIIKEKVGGEIADKIMLDITEESEEVYLRRSTKK